VQGLNLRCLGGGGVSGVEFTLRGVRISCDIVARNCDFASFAAWVQG
jgi:hypothetical protein